MGHSTLSTLDEKIATELVVILEFDARPNDRDLEYQWMPGGLVFNSLNEKHFIDSDGSAMVAFSCKPPVLIHKKKWKLFSKI